MCRMSLIAPLDQSTSCMTARSRVLQVLSRCETVNSIVALLSINFHALELDVKREQQMRQKPGSGSGLADSVLISALTSGPLMLTSADLAPVRHIPWALSLTSAVLYSANLVTVMMFPIAMEVRRFTKNKTNHKLSH